MNSRPMALTTRACRPSGSSTTTLPAPGVPGGKFSGRSRRGVSAMIRDDFLAVPGVVAQRDHVGAGGEQRARHFGRQAEAVRGVLGIHHREVDAQARAQVGQRGGDGFAAGAADHVAQEQDTH